MSSSSAVNEWDNDYARVARIASQFRTQGLNKNTNSGQAEPRQLFQHITRLDESLSTLPLQANQIQRRRRLLQHLRGHRIESMSSGSYRPPTEGGQSQMAAAMQQQDAMIDELAVGVGRLRDQTQVIGDEARMHVDLLDNMEQNLDTAHDGLDAETRRAARLKEDQSVWRLQLIVAGLFVLFILLFFMGMSP
mmetsp:Transcript_9360/g.23303  ORF Transcript_9360/g.23303 Transcript_9360/m.23303 type:complete len:192 (+) Transcript_9360:114-689(+)|eukprot:CAMPEP_0116094638 /NCGR_PEP_ID=MMETSP0327-20121206/9240_1 /TAXON_ID=44447 /ORGANISM="Pseudo-nitzschia delicatissima, Strain B596" /LENGTH=191 /DNA_ID=CAMNT_0003586259 /DNA_START=261 /DNA_END=836 /DNA_ORIENTATION=-